VIKQLQASNTIPIERAKMRIRLTIANKEGKRLKEKVVPLVDKVEEEDWTDEWELVSFMNWGLRSFVPGRRH
jgi:ribosome maturation protein SDO1